MIALPPKHCPEREHAILEAVRNNQHDTIEWHAVQLEHRGVRGEVFVMGDALKIGGVRYGCSARTQQQIADLLDASLCTDRICDASWDQATVPKRLRRDRSVSTSDVASTDAPVTTCSELMM